MGKEPFVRKYVFSDKNAVRSICIETADLTFKKNKKVLECVPIIYNDYFTQQEPENIFVLDNGDGKAVGYILCSADYNKFIKKNRDIYLRRVVKTHFPSCSVLILYLMQMRKMKKYPVHLHIDILPEYQHRGYGSELINTLCEHLKKSGCSHLSVCGINRNSSAYRFYKKCGFYEFYDCGFNNALLTKKL